MQKLVPLVAAIALALAAFGCQRDEVPNDPYPGNDPDQTTDMTVEPMHNYADDAEEEINEENAEDVLDQVDQEVEEDIKDAEGMQE